MGGDAALRKGVGARLQRLGGVGQAVKPVLVLRQVAEGAVGGKLHFVQLRL